MSSPAMPARTRLPKVGDLAAARARLRVVSRPRTVAPTMPFVLLVTLILVGGVVSLLMFNTSMQQASFAATDLEDQATALTARQESLQMQLEDLRNPQHVAEQAHRLGMVLPGATGFIHLADGTRQPAPALTEPATPLRLQGLPARKPAVYRETVSRSARDTGSHLTRAGVSSR